MTLKLFSFFQNLSFISPNGTPPNPPTLCFIQENLFYMNNDIEMTLYLKNPSFISPNGTPPNLPTLFFIEEDLFYMNSDIEMIFY